MRGWKQRDMFFWKSKKAEIVLILFLTSGFVAFICLWLLVLPNSNNLINHVLYFLLAELLTVLNNAFNVISYIHYINLLFDLCCVLLNE